MQIMSNFSSSMKEFLDDRQRWKSITELKANTDVLMPVGFQVYCEAEASWYVLASATNENDPGTYTWVKLIPIEADNVYTKQEINGLINTKANANEIYSKNEIDNKLATKANSTNVYTKSETDNAITSKVSEIVAGAPEDFDTLKEMSDWISEHEDSAAAMNSAILSNTNNISSLQSGKVDKVTGKGLSTNDFTDDYQEQIETHEDDIFMLKNDVAVNRATLGTYCKNLLNCICKPNITDMYGLTFTNNGDGTIILDGIATDSCGLIILKNVNISKGTYTLSGCPSGGSTGGYSLMAKINSETGIVLDRKFDFGDGVTFECPDCIIEIIISCSTGAIIDNVTFRPQLEPGSSVSEYEPYKESIVTRLTQTKEDISSLDSRITTNSNSISILDTKLNNHTSITSKTLSGSGWYRFFEYNGANVSEALFSSAAMPTFTLLRTYQTNNNELHKIDLTAVYQKFQFINENSMSNILIIKKIRMVRSSTNSYVDIYYSGTYSNLSTGIVTNADTSGTRRDIYYWKAIAEPYAVEETVDGESILATYNFSANRTIESRITTNETNIATIEARHNYGYTYAQTSAGVGWHKALECTFSETNSSIRQANFLVTSNLNYCGILSVFFLAKSGATLGIDGCNCKWISRHNLLKKDDFVLVSKLDTENDKIIAELWVNISTLYRSYSFIRLNSLNRCIEKYGDTVWKCCTSTTASESYPTDYDNTYVSVDASTAKYDASGKDISAKLAELKGTLVTSTYSCTASDTYEYTGLSADIPGGSVYEIKAYDRYGNACPTGICIASTSDPSKLKSNTMIAENIALPSEVASDYTSFVNRSTSGIVTNSSNATLYVHVKRKGTGANQVGLYYRKLN